MRRLGDEIPKRTTSGTFCFNAALSEYQLTSIPLDQEISRRESSLTKVLHMEMKMRLGCLQGVQKYTGEIKREWKD
jgi:hypothetical protein